MNTCKGTLQEEQERLFFVNIAESFSKFIFEKAGSLITGELTMEQLKKLMEDNTEGAGLLNMFCGEDNVALV